MYKLNDLVETLNNTVEERDEKLEVLGENNCYCIYFIIGDPVSFQNVFEKVNQLNDLVEIMNNTVKETKDKVQDVEKEDKYDCISL